ncbi:c-type cytochrome [Halomonas sp. HNIBRBA4712]|uniref:c-type cytochrome n=1 Tax=Halomonas sp. HNIBRBA4712 TaxID=3373087 RepID=UPI00374646EC
MTKPMRWITTLLLLGVVALAVFVAAVLYDLNRSIAPIDQADADPSAEALEEKIARGEYIAHVSDCVACHTVPGEAPFAGGYGLETPFGELFASNITPDDETGIGGWELADFDRALRHGQGSNGYLYPAMPYTAYARLSDQDVSDLWAYMQTIEPVEHEVNENQFPFPYNQRWLLAGWNLLFFHEEATANELAQSQDPVERGRYLVEGAGHCSACHSPKNALGANSGEPLSGATLQGWHAPDLTPNAHTGLGKWSSEQVVDYLKSGTNEFAVAAGPMREAVENSTQYMTDEDLSAIAAYLQSVPESSHTAPQPLDAGEAAMRQGASIYATQCSACHVSHGEGVRQMIPSLVGNSQVNAPDPASLLQVVLKGAEGPDTYANPTGAGMPAFDWKLSDEEVANVLTYVRNSWGNAAEPVTAAEVATERDARGARSALKASRE